MPIDARKAAEAAAVYYKDLSNSESRLTIEEVERDPSDQYWMITLGIADSYGLGGLGSVGKIGAYKIFKIDADTGMVESMKIRDI